MEKSKYLNTSLIIFFALVGLTNFNVAAFDSKDYQAYQNDYFNRLKSLCEQSFHGISVYPEGEANPFNGEPLLITFSSCTDKKIAIPFQVGNDKSRTWLISKSNKGLLLQHDHRHLDGSPDEINLYGGYALKQGSISSQSFLADHHTATQIPEAKTNVWHISFEKNSTLSYFLERNSKPRYKAIFDISTQVKSN